MDPILVCYARIIPVNQGFHGTNQLMMGLIKSFSHGSCELNAEARYIMVKKGRDVYLYGGHDPEDFQHQVGDPPTVLITSNLLDTA
jgi:hypothetical protein